MRCHICGAATTVSETRATGEGYVLHRRRVCVNNHRFSTYEVDDSMRLTIGKFATRAERIKNLVAKSRRWQRNAQIAARAASGEKHSVLAAEFGMSDNMVSTLVKRHR